MTEDHDLVYEIGRKSFVFASVKMREEYEDMILRIQEEITRLRLIEARQYDFGRNKK